MDAAIELDCGIATSRIVGWLDCELKLPRSDQGWMFADSGHSCNIEATPLESRPLGAISLERTLLVARGDAEALDAFNKLFTLRFASAGG